MAKKPRTLARSRSKAAYTLVDLSALHEETRKDILADALEGGGTYGIRVVEESVNGGARAPIFGVYNEGPDADKWTEAKKELGLDGTEIPDGEVRPLDIEITDPRREAALREAAAQRAAGEADRIRAGETEALREIVGDDADEGRESPTPNMSANRSGATDGHTTNIVDSTLSQDAENEAGNAKSADEAEDNRRTAKKNKSPK